jgi:hypothetical protein
MARRKGGDHVDRPIGLALGPAPSLAIHGDAAFRNPYPSSRPRNEAVLESLPIQRRQNVAN